VGGTVQVLLGQPFGKFSDVQRLIQDIVKVRLQSRPDLYPGAIAAAKSIWKDEGPLAFYKVQITADAAHLRERWSP